MSKNFTRKPNKKNEQDILEEWEILQKWNKLDEDKKLELWKDYKCWDKFYYEHINIIKLTIRNTFIKFKFNRLHDIEDVSGKVFLNLIETEALKSFDPKRMKLKNYLKVIAFRVAYNWVKKHYRIITGFDDEQEESESTDIKPLIDMYISIKRTYQRILEGRESLLRVFELYYICGKNVKTIAQELGKSEGAINTTLTRIKDLFKENKKYFM